MAFVGAPGVLVRSSFSGGAVSHAPSTPIARGPRMGLTDVEKKSFAPIWGKSAWREDEFTGGFPGGEEAFYKWIEDGGKAEVPDLPDYLQPTDADAPPKAPSGLTEVEKKSFAPIWGSSEWREDVFTGGFPGGEGAYYKWIEEGGEADVPDLPDFLQPKADSGAAVAEKGAIAGVMDFISDKLPFGGKGDAPADKPVTLKIGGRSVVAEPTPMAAPAAPVDPEAPAESLFEKYYPKATRFLAPHISIVDERDFRMDKVGVSMEEVTASPVDVHYPKETKNKAPVITLDYNGNLATASLSMVMKEIEPLPSSIGPVKNGETVTKLLPGRGGGLKLEFDVQGEGPTAFLTGPPSQG